MTTRKKERDETVLYYCFDFSSEEGVMDGAVHYDLEDTTGYGYIVEIHIPNKEVDPLRSVAVFK